MKIIQKILPQTRSRLILPPLTFPTASSLSQIRPYNDTETGGNSTTQLHHEGHLVVSGQVVVDEKSGMLKDGVYGGITFEVDDLQESDEYGGWV
jgi:hypothetical protein